MLTNVPVTLDVITHILWCLLNGNANGDT